MSNTPKISIIVPVYNVEKYLNRCIDSILAQTFTDWELLLVDDGSTDRSGEICDEYAEKDSRIRVFHKENGGVSKARNTGIKNSTGGWITFMDSDDWLESDAFSNVTNIIIRYDCEIIKTGYNRVYANGHTTTRITSYKKLYKSHSDMLLHLYKSSYSTFLWNTWIKSEIAKSFTMDEDICWCEDHIYTCRCLGRANKIYVTDKITYNYVFNNLNVDCSATNLSNQLHNWQMVYKAAILNYSICLEMIKGNHNQELHQILDNRYIYMLEQGLYYSLFQHQLLDAIRTLKHTGQFNVKLLKSPINHYIRTKIKRIISKCHQ